MVSVFPSKRDTHRTPTVSRMYHGLDETIAPAVQHATSFIDAMLLQLCGNHPWRIVFLTVTAILILQYCTSAAVAAVRAVQLHGLSSLLAHAALQLPILRGMVAREKQKIAKKLQADVRAASDDADDHPLDTLPAKGLAPSAVRARIARKQRKCVQVDDGKSTMSGTVYIAGKVGRKVAPLSNTTPSGVEGNAAACIRRL